MFASALRHRIGSIPLIHRIFRAVTGKAGPRFHLVIKYSSWTKTWSIRTYLGYQSRNISSIHLMAEALENVKHRFRRSFRTAAWLGDKPPEWYFTGPHLAYCRSPQDQQTTLIPCHCFWSWPEAGIPSYECLIAEMVAASALPFCERGLFWIGSAEKHFTRKILFDLAEHDDRIVARTVEWIGDTAITEKSRMGTKMNNYTSLPDHCRYQYLIDLQGGGYSGRLKILLFSGRPLFIQNRIWEEFFSFKLQPFVHYIPVAEDMSDLIEKLDWADNHSVEAAGIAQCALEFALANLTRRNAVEEYERVFLGLASGNDATAAT